MLVLEKHGVCSWLLNKDKPLVILDGKFEDFDKLTPHGKVFKLEKEQDNYLEIFYGNKNYLILKDAIIIAHYPSFLDIGSSVYIMDKPEKNGIIVDRYWHFKENEPFYIVSFKGKVSSKRFFSKDIMENQ